MQILINLKVKWTGGEVIINPPPIDPPIEPPLVIKPEGYLSLEDFGGQSYYKRIDKGLTYNGNIIKSDIPIFSLDDLGKTFCGLFANRNPQEVNLERVDEYYPNIIGSRYSKIIEVVSPTEIKVDFNYNTGSNKGYIFFDNSEAYQKLMETYLSDNSIGIWLEPKRTYVVREFTNYKAPTHKDFIIESSDKAYLKLGIEDYFQWNKSIGKSIYKTSGYLFDVGVSDKDFTSKNIVYLPPHRRIPESQSTGLRIFWGNSIAEQTRTISVIGNTALDEMRAIGDNVTNEIFYGVGLGVLYAGGTYTGDGSNIEHDIDKYMTVIVEDFEHEGPSFCDLKANMGGGLLLKAKNIYTNFKDENKYAPTSVKMKGRLTTDYSGIAIKDKSKYPSHVIEITSDNSFYQTANTNGTRGWANANNLFFIDKFVFWQPTGNYWKYLYEQWFNTGTKNNWIVNEDGGNFFTGRKMIMPHIPRSGHKYIIGRKYNQEGKTIGTISKNKIKGSVNWSAIQNKNWNEISGITGMPIQLQPNDKFKVGSEVYTVISTEREIFPLFEKEVMPWGGHDSVVSYFPVYTLDKNLPDNLPISFEIEMINSEAEVLLDGREFEFYSVYKSNKNLNGHTLNTKFGDENILESNPFGHVSYNHQQVSVWAENWQHNGFFRQSENNYSNFPSFNIPEGKTESLRRWANLHTYINCSGFEGQFDPSFNFWIRDAVYRTLGKQLPEQECVRLYGCTEMNSLENRNDKYVKNFSINEKPELPQKIKDKIQ